MNVQRAVRFYPSPVTTPPVQQPWRINSVKRAEYLTRGCTMVGDFSTSELSERRDGNIMKLVAIMKGRA